MTRDGFLIPNASDVAPNYQPSQPDKGDFVILGNAQHGVISGCKVTLTGFSVSVGVASNEYGNILVAGGEIRLLGSVPPLSIRSADPVKARFDLVVYSLASGVSVLTGTSSVNPVYPDINEGVTVLAAVYVPAAADASDLIVIDKRQFLQSTITAVDITTVGVDEAIDIVSSRLSTSSTPVFKINGDGKINWGPDSAIEKDGTANIKVTGSLTVPNVAAESSVTVAGNEVVTEAKISWGTTHPAVTPADKGKIFVNTSTADVEVYSSLDGGGYGWVALESAVPSGTVIQSFVDKDTMLGYGWLLLDGSSYPKSQALNLWTNFPSWRDGDNVVIPNMTGRFPLGNASVGSANVGDTNGSSSTTGSVSFTITENNMPSHSHRSGTATSPATHSHDQTSTAPGGAHTHGDGFTVDAGSHSHSITDKPHSHPMLFADFIVTRHDGEGDSCLDMPFTDSSHHWRTQPASRTWENVTGITSTNPVGTHQHVISESAEHSHTLTITESGSHSHTLPDHNPKGGDQPITLTFPSMNIYFYIKM